MADVYLYADETGDLDMLRSPGSNRYCGNDSHSTRAEVFELIPRQQPRLDARFLLKANAYEQVKRAGSVRPYKPAFGHAPEDICGQVGGGRVVLPGTRDAPSAGDLQVADYGLWATQCEVEGRACPWYSSCVAPTLHSTLMPWGRAW